MEKHLMEDPLDLGLSPEEAFQTQPQVIADTSTLDNLVRDLTEAWEKVEKQDEVLKTLKEKFNELEGRLVTTLRAIEKSEYYVKGLGTYKVNKKSSVSLPNSLENLRAFRKYVVENYGEPAAEGLFSVNSQKLNAWVKKEEEAKPGVAIPGLSTPFERFSIGFPSAAQVRKEQGGSNG